MRGRRDAGDGVRDSQRRAEANGAGVAPPDGEPRGPKGAPPSPRERNQGFPGVVAGRHASSLVQRARGLLWFLLGVAAASAFFAAHSSAGQQDSERLVAPPSDGPRASPEGGGGSTSAQGTDANTERGFVSRQDLAKIAQGIATQRTVIMTVCNAGYLDFLENWLHFAGKLALDRHLLVVAEDLETWEFAQSLRPGQAVRIHVPEIELADARTVAALGLSGSGETGGSESEFNSPRFKKMMYRRVFYIRELLYARVNVLLTDTDIVFMRDPLPYMIPTRFDLMTVPDDPDPRGFREVSAHKMSGNVTLQMLQRLNFCGGFLFFRSTPATWVMVDLLAMKLFRAAKATGKENEQTFLALVMWEALQLRPPARIGVLPQQLFVPGWLHFSDNKYGYWRKVFRRTTTEDPVIIHNNWITGKDTKIQRFKEKGLWALGST